MNVLTKKSTCVFVSVAILSSIQITVGIANTNAQSEVDQIMKGVYDLEREGDQLILRMEAEDRRYVSGLSCSQLNSEASQYGKQGDFWAAQTNISNYASRASGNYNAAERRLNQYNRKCR